MIVLQIIIGVIAAVGVGFLMADLMKIPSLKASKAANSVGRKGKKKTGVIELYRRDFATKLAGKLHLNEFKRANLVIDLRTANMEQSAGNAQLPAPSRSGLGRIPPDLLPGVRYCHKLYVPSALLQGLQTNL